MNLVNSFVVFGGGRRFTMAILSRRAKPERFARERLVIESPTSDRMEHLGEPAAGRVASLIEAEDFLVAGQVPRLDVDVRPLDCALQQAPEVFESVRVNESLA